MANCAQCQRELAQGQEILIKDTSGRNAAYLPYCSFCAAEKEKEIQLETQDLNYFGALLVGGAAGIVGGLIWYAIVIWTETQFAYLAIAIGFLVGLGVFFGAGKKRGLPLQIMSALITLTGMALGEYMIIRHFIVEAMRAEGHRSFPLLYPLEDMFEILKAGVSADPIILLFWLFALVVAFAYPARRKLLRQDPKGYAPGPGGYPG
jgi:hypothetical protein